MGEVKTTWKGDIFQDLAVSTDGQRVVALCANQTVRVYGVTDGVCEW